MESKSQGEGEKDKTKEAVELTINPNNVKARRKFLLSG